MSLNPNLPIRFGSAYKASAALAINTAETIIAPAANVRGMIVWMAGVYTQSANGTPIGVLLTKASAPTSNIDGNVILGAGAAGGVGASYQSSNKLDKPVFIPAGQGLYFIADEATVAKSHRYVNYDLL